MEYGRCPCSGIYEARRVEVSLTAPDGQRKVMDSVPQGACPLCRSRVYKAPILDLVETLMYAVKYGG